MDRSFPIGFVVEGRWASTRKCSSRGPSLSNTRTLLNRKDWSGFKSRRGSLFWQRNGRKARFLSGHIRLSRISRKLSSWRTGGTLAATCSTRRRTDRNWSSRSDLQVGWRSLWVGTTAARDLLCPKPQQFCFEGIWYEPPIWLKSRGSSHCWASCKRTLG